MIISRQLWKSMQGMLLAIGAMVVFAVLGLVLAALLPSLFGYESLIVYGDSMAPFLRIGDVAVIQPVGPEDLRIGDVVTYRSSANPRVLVTHRIIQVKRQDGVPAFETKGDASPNVDYWSVSGDTVVGRVVYKVPVVGFVFDFAKGLPGRLLLVGLPALLLVIETSRRKHAPPSLDDKVISKIDDQTEHQEVAPQDLLANSPVVLANQLGSLASPGAVVKQARVVDKRGETTPSSTKDHHDPWPSDSRRRYSPTNWLHPIDLHPIPKKSLWLRAFGRLLPRPATPSDRCNASQV